MAAESTASANPPSRPPAPAAAAPSVDSYIGSLISLTSKSEIRYEGVLYNINTHESSIGLRNVRSFGTEGRKKEGPQIPASEKIYEYILFRGSDIKDLQVKSSPPAQSTAIHNDPAIIQSHYPHGVSTTTSIPSVGTGTVVDLSSNTTQLGLPRPTFQGNLPIYQPGAGLSPWGSSAPPAANGSSLTLPPMYWQYYAPSSGFPHLQQPPPLLRPPGLSVPQTMQQPLQYPGINSSLPSAPQNLPDFGSPLFPPASSTSTLISSSLPSMLAPASSSLLGQEVSSSLLPNNSSVTTPASTAIASASLVPSVTTVVDPVITMPHSMPSGVSNKSNIVTAPTVQYRSNTLPAPPVAASSSSSQVETSPPLVTPGQLQTVSSSTLPSSELLHTGLKNIDAKALEPDVRTVEAKAKPLLPAPATNNSVEANEPILPLPTPNIQKPNGTASYSHYNNRGRGRGRGTAFSRSVTKFTEDFDFTAMNEKFNKDEVWGHLGKNKSQLKEDEFNEDDYDDILEADENEAMKPVYVKDDFFDTLSCGTTHDRGTNNGRIRFSEQLKLDSETFGDSARHHTNRGRRGFRGGGGGRGRGPFYGRGGYGGYAGRGRGQFMSNRPF